MDSTDFSAIEMKEHWGGIVIVIPSTYSGVDVTVSWGALEIEDIH